MQDAAPSPTMVLWAVVAVMAVLAALASPGLGSAIPPTLLRMEKKKKMEKGKII